MDCDFYWVCNNCDYWVKKEKINIMSYEDISAAIFL